MSLLFLFYAYGAHRDLHVLTHSFPTRRSSDLADSPGEVLLAGLALEHVPKGVGGIGHEVLPSGIGLAACFVQQEQEDRTRVIRSLGQPALCQALQGRRGSDPGAGLDRVVAQELVQSAGPEAELSGGLPVYLGALPLVLTPARAAQSRCIVDAQPEDRKSTRLNSSH